MMISNGGQQNFHVKNNRKDKTVWSIKHASLILVCLVFLAKAQVSSSVLDAFVRLLCPAGSYGEGLEDWMDVL